MRSRGTALALDLMLVATLLAWGQAEVWGEGDEVIVGADWANAVVFAFVSIALLARRTHPVAVLLAQSSALSVLVVSAGGTSQALGWFVPLCVAVYAVGRYRDEGSGKAAGLTVGTLLLVMLLTDAAAGRAVTVSSLIGTSPFEVMLLASWFLGRYARNRLLLTAADVTAVQMAAATREAESRQHAAEERQALAVELHDVLAPGLTVMVRQAEAAEARLGRDPEAAQTSIRAVAETGRASLDEVRHFMAQLRHPETTETDTPGFELLDKLVADLGTAALEVTLAKTGDLAEVPTGPAGAAYRIVQEALTNALRHGRASKAAVSLAACDRELVVEVTDNGHGAAAGLVPGTGISGMRRRAEVWKGDVTVSPVPEGGVRMSAVLRWSSP
jgi:signal transduction histidine kinase